MRKATFWRTIMKYQIYLFEVLYLRKEDKYFVYNYL